MPGKDIFEKYEEITKLGKGHDVWVVLDKECKKVFIKKCRHDFDPEVYESISHIQDIHIPRIFQYQELEGILYIIEEYITGETLQEKMDQGYIFSKAEAIKLLIQLCEALECLHIRFHPIIHRDIKPSNIMISGDGIIKLIDYNGARCYEEGMSQDTRHIGTPGFAAPEQYGFFQSDARTDIYGTGVVLNYLLTGRHISEEIAPGKPGKIVKKCTHIDPEKRYGSVSEVKKELQKVLKRSERLLWWYPVGKMLAGPGLYAGSIPHWRK